MSLNPQQIFANFVLQKVVPSLPAGAAATNLEWNSKKFLGQVPGETLDAATYGGRVQSDLEQSLAANPGNAELTNAIATVAERFGLAPSAANVAASAHGASAHSGGGAPAGDLASVAAAAQAGVGAAASVDINEVLSAKADAAGESLAWDTSVVDLLKLMGKESSVSARRGFMTALGLDAGTAGTADGNEALRQALMGALASTGGHWPAGLA